METNLEKFDPSTLMQGVKDRIKATFVSLIPDEQWDKMVKNEVDDYFKPKQIGYSSDRKMASDFQILVRNIIENEATKKLKEYLTSPDFITMWAENGIPIASGQVKQMCIENSGQILANFYAGIFQNMLSMVANNLNVRQY